MRVGWLAALIALSGCGLLPRPVPEQVAGFDPVVPMEPPVGPVLRLGGGELDGEAWEVVAYRSADGDLCTHQSQGAGGGGGCGERVAEGATFGSIGISETAGGAVIVHAILSGDARRVRLETAAGPVEVDVLTLGAIGSELTGFAEGLPSTRQPTAMVALDAGGSELERFELDIAERAEPGDPGPGQQPTPESP